MKKAKVGKGLGGLGKATRGVWVTTKDFSSFSIRITPSNRVVRSVRSTHNGDPWYRTIAIANDLFERLERAVKRVAERGYLTKREINQTGLAEALWYAQLPEVKVITGREIYRKEVRCNEDT